MCLNMKNIYPKHVQGFEPQHLGTFSGQHMCQLLRAHLVFTRVQAKTGVVRQKKNELNSCLQMSYRNSRLDWISRLQSISLPDCDQVYFLCSAQNISLNGDLGGSSNSNFEGWRPKSTERLAEQWSETWCE